MQIPRAVQPAIPDEFPAIWQIEGHPVALMGSASGKISAVRELVRALDALLFAMVAFATALSYDARSEAEHTIKNWDS